MDNDISSECELSMEQTSHQRVGSVQYETLVYNLNSVLNFTAPGTYKYN